MADYWKSQAKKFCDFCKCWIADNKPSIGFHESGKRHKENVAKRLSEISKDSTKSYNEELQVDREMKKMEEEAFKAYMKDLQDNPDYTSKRILEETERRKKELEESVKQQNETKDVPKCVKQEEQQSENPIISEKLWHEAKSDEGYTYYWNVNTAESKWEPPEEGYVSLEDQQKQQKEIELKNELKRRRKEEKSKQKQEESVNSKEKETTSKKRRRKEKHDKVEDSTATAGPAPKPDPYGAWETVIPKIEEPIDLQLPKQEYIAIKVPEFTEPEIKFKEKTIASLGYESENNNFKKEIEESSCGFKKRKFRGNMRQKLDTE